MGVLSARRTRCRSRVCMLLGFCGLFYIIVFISKTSLFGDEGRFRRSKPLGEPFGDPSSRRTFNSLNLDEGQCDATFPGLTRDINDAAALGPFSLKQARDMGPLQVRIKDGQLYIVHMEDKDILTREKIDSRMSTLHQLHRAILTSPTPLPDTVISINIQDEPIDMAWSYSRPAYDAPTPGHPHIAHAFLMPHFSFWGWPLPFIGSFARAATAITRLESRLLFPLKNPRAVWRGTRRYNNAHNPTLREDLLRATRGKKWADVQELSWGAKGVATNALMVEDFCRYKYVLHTEGITYSGRFQLLQMCGSVLLTPPVAWLQHTTHLIRPLFTSDMDLQGLGGKSKGEKGWVPEEGVRKAWPVHYGPGEANIVFVAPDWSDLEDTIRWLEERPEVAEGIARRQRELFVEKGYFSPAAEVCYWRALIRGWSRVVQTEGQGWDQQQGVRWELFALGYEKE